MVAKTGRPAACVAVLCFSFTSLRTAVFSQWEVLVFDGINSTVVNDALAEFGAGVSVTVETTSAAFVRNLPEPRRGIWSLSPIRVARLTPWTLSLLERWRSRHRRDIRPR